MQRTGQSERMARGAALGIRREHRHPVSRIHGGFHQSTNAVCKNTVVI